jgi:putative ABC transport system permease protein
VRVLRAWLWRVAGFLRPERGERDFDAELESHLELHVADERRAGHSTEEARRRALASLGSLAAVREAQRERRGLPRLDSLGQDLHYALRGLRRRPGFAAACIATLALGIGVNSAIFSVVRAVLLAPLPYRAPDQLLALWIENPAVGRGPGPMAGADVLELRESFAGVGGVEAFQANVIPISVGSGGDTVDAQAVRVAPNVFELLGRDALVGRVLRDADRHDAVVLGHGFWQRRFGADPTIVGRGVAVGGRAVTVVGVMPAGFTFPYPSMLRAPVSFTASSDIDLWLALDLPAARTAPAGARLIGAVARTAPGRSAGEAQPALEAAWARIVAANPSTHDGWQLRVTSLHEDAVAPVRPMLVLLLGCVGVVLLTACVNVANLLLARGVARQGELAMRQALGAGRARLWQQGLVESLVIAGLGAATGLLFARWATPLLVRVAPAGTPRLAEVSSDAAVAAFAAAIAVVCAVAMATIQATGRRVPTLTAVMNGGRTVTAGRRTLRHALVAVEVALAVALAVGGGLLTRSLIAVLQVDPGYRTDRVLTLGLTVPGRYRSDAMRVDFYRAIFDRLQRIPGVISVGGVTRLPLGGANSSTPVAVEGRVPPPGQWPEADFRRALHDYFATMGIPLQRGRTFTDADRGGVPPVVVVNAAFAARMFGDEDPIGREIHLGSASPLPRATVIGVVGDLRHSRLDAPPMPEVYVHYLQAVPVAPFVVIRTADEPAALASAVRAVLAELDATMTLYNVRTMADLRTASMAGRRFVMGLVVAFGLLALTLAAVGVFGVVALTVAERTREMGIRLALGAPPRRLTVMVVVQVLGVATAGVVAGLLLALAASPLLTAQLYGVGIADPITLAVVAALILAVAGLAAAIPAARLLRVDPLSTLRAQ